jgi:L-serine dehydratase
MKKIVAAPTAGSCGVIPAILLTYEEQYHISLDKMVEAMYVASGIGEVIAYRAFLAGAAGGCQAEVGAASAMAAGALVYLNGGDCESIAHAAAMALKNLLGLVCDTVAGLVEVPCVKRNVVGAVNAISGADMAIAGIRSRIPPDEVIDAMRDIGEALPSSLRETGQVGLAATPTGQEIALRIIE